VVCGLSMCAGGRWPATRREYPFELGSADSHRRTFGVSPRRSLWRTVRWQRTARADRRALGGGLPFRRAVTAAAEPLAVAGQASANHDYGDVGAVQVADAGAAVVIAVAVQLAPQGSAVDQLAMLVPGMI
jgi:hypothetical protein